MAPLPCLSYLSFPRVPARDRTSPGPCGRQAPPEVKVPVVARPTENIGTRTVAALQRAGHEVVRISRSLGVDLITGHGLEAALAGVDAVVDATSYETADRDDAVAYFGTTTRVLLTAEERAGIRHHVLLSIVGVDRIEGNAHYAGQREQECLVTEGPVPWTIVRVTQFYDFALPSEGMCSRSTG
jgi:uncharacterized protein YbjT (DUF2867 family)